MTLPSSTNSSSISMGNGSNFIGASWTNGSFYGHGAQPPYPRIFTRGATMARALLDHLHNSILDRMPIHSSVSSTTAQQNYVNLYAQGNINSYSPTVSAQTSMQTLANQVQAIGTPPLTSKLQSLMHTISSSLGGGDSPSAH